MERINENKFEEVFYPSKTPQKAIIIVTGSDSGTNWAKQIAKQFCSQSISSLAMAYWGTKHTSKTLSLIPIEIVLSAVEWLKIRGYTKIGIYGFSKGAEFALVAASLIPQIEFVIAVSPSCCVFEGIAKPKYSGTSSWTWKSKPLSFASFEGVSVNILSNILRNGEYGFLKQYLDVIKRKKDAENSIQVEQINGPILLLSAENDAQWPSVKMGEILCDRLKDKQFPFSYLHKTFPIASHILCPVKTKKRFVYKNERNHPKECENSRIQAFTLALEWLSEI